MATLDEFEAFRRVIRAMDREYLTIRSKKPGDNSVDLSDVAAVQSMLRSVAQPDVSEQEMLMLKRRMQAEAAKEERREVDHGQ